MPSLGPFRKTRLAPTPSGFLHLGNLFSFGLTAALAEAGGAGTLLRIDDMDRDRVNATYLQDVFDTLHFMDIPWNEGPRNASDFEAHYSQHHRLPHYQAALGKLRSLGLLYACDCSRAQVLRQSPEGIYPGTCRHKGLPLDAPNVAWRLHTDPHARVTLHQADGSTHNTTLPTDMHDVVLRKKDGFPAYQLSSVIDDVHYGVDLIVRGQDLWPSTLVQVYLAGLLGESGFLSARFHHHSLLLDDGARKLSKSAGDTSLHDMRRRGLRASDIYLQLGKSLGMKEPLTHWRQMVSLLAPA